MHAPNPNPTTYDAGAQKDTNAACATTCKATKTEHNGTSARRSTALNAAISGVLPQITAVH